MICGVVALVAVACSTTPSTERRAALFDPATEFRFPDGGKMDVEQDGVSRLSLRARDGRLFVNGRDLGPYDATMPIRFLPGDTILVGGRRVSY
ncbi:MAG: hypothetical protein ACYTGZ_16930 [Planctomycetota bacterium]